MELRHLRYFVTVAEHKSFRRAAEQLHVSQPPLSMQIKQLEAELGLVLFERTSRSVRLSAAATNLLQMASSILSQADHLVATAKQQAKGEVGTLAVGYLPAALGPLLSAALRSFSEAHPRVQVSMVEQRVPSQIAALMAGALDLGMMFGPVDKPELASELLRESPVTLALPPQHRLAKKSKIRLNELNGEQLVLMRPDLVRGFYDPFLAACAAAGVVMPVSRYTNDFASKLWLVGAGFGVSPTMPPPAGYVGSNVVYRPVVADLPHWKLFLIYRQNNRSQVLANFLEEVRRLRKQR